MEWDIWKKTLKLKLQEPSVPTCLTKISFGGIPNSRNVLLSFIPHIDLWGFCFWFWYPLAPSVLLPSLSLTQSLTHSHSHSSLTLTHSLTHSLTHHFPSLSLTQSLNHSHSHSHWRPSGAPWSPPLLRGRRGTTCIGKGSDVRPGVPLASLWCHLVSAAFAWQAWTNVHWQGVGCTPWRPSGVPLVPLGLRRFCVAGVAQRALASGRMYALVSLWRPSGPSVLLLPSFPLTHTLTHHSLSLIHSLIHLLITFLPFHSLTLSLITHSHSFTHSLTHHLLTHITHLLRTIIANSDVECILRAKNTPIKPDRKWLMTRGEKIQKWFSPNRLRQPCRQ